MSRKIGLTVIFCIEKDNIYTHLRRLHSDLPGIVDKVWKKAQSLGYGKYFSDNEGGYIIDDHVYVNKMGIPSIDIIQYDASSDSGFNPQWHTVHDTMDHIDKETLKAVGQTVLAVIYNE